MFEGSQLNEMSSENQTSLWMAQNQVKRRLHK